jgi:hypothetical protein
MNSARTTAAAAAANIRKEILQRRQAVDGLYTELQMALTVESFAPNNSYICV